MKFEVTEHMLELDGPVLPFQFTPGVMFTYNFHWLWHQLYLDGKFFAQAFSHMRFSNDSRNVPDLDVEDSDDIGISFTLDKYTWLSFDRTNQTIYGMPPITPVLPVFPHIPLNITCRGREINAEIYVTSLAASAWVQSARPAAITLLPGTSFTYDFTLELLESVAYNPSWDVFIRFDDPFEQSSWLEFDPTTRVLSGTVPINSPPRDITALATSNAWGFNTTTSYIVTVDNPGYTPSAPKFVWSQTVIALLISLVIVVLFLAMTICVCCGLREGCLVSYPALIAYYRRPRPSSQTLVDNNSEFAVGCCGGLEAGNKGDEIQPDTEKKAETRTTPIVTPEHHDAPDPIRANTTQHPFAEAAPANAPSLLSVPSVAPGQPRPSSQTLVDNNSELAVGCCGGLEAGNKGDEIQPDTEQKAETRTTSIVTPEHHDAPDPIRVNTTQHPFAEAAPANAPSLLPVPSVARAQSASGAAEPQAKSVKKCGLGKHVFLKKRVLFGKGNGKNISSGKLATISSSTKPNDAPFTPMWNGHVYQTPALLAAEERGWQARRQERKARLKREFFARKQAEDAGVEPRTDTPEESTPNDDAPRRFGIFEQLAAMEDLDRKGPANMRGDSIPRSCLVEIGENRFFDDAMLDRSEVGSSEFSSLASWETLSESSLPNMVLCYGQLGRRKTKEGVPSRGIPSAVDHPIQPVSCTQKLPGPTEDTLTDENRLNRIAHSLGSKALDGGHSGSNAPKIREPLKEINNAGNSGAVVTYSPIKWKGVARGEHGSPTTSQHSPTFKKLAHQRFRASVDSKLGSPLSRAVLVRTPTYISPSTRSIGSTATRVGANVSPTVSLADVVRIESSGMQFYFVAAKTRFCFKIQVAEAVSKAKGKQKSRTTKDVLYKAEVDGHFNTEMPAWLHFNPSTLEFWGQAPDTRELLQYSMRVVSHPANKIVCQILMAVARPPLLAAAQASLGNPTGGLDTLEASSSRKLSSLYSPHNSRGFGSPLQSSRSIVTSKFGSSLSMASIVFHFNQDGVEVFVVPATTKFCFEIPIAKPTGEPKSTELALGRATASPYSIQLEDILSDDPEGEIAPTGPQTPKRPQNPVPTSSSYAPSSWRGVSPGSRRSLVYPSPSRRNLGLGTPGSKSGRRLRMKTPMSARQTGCEDYDSVMFEGHSYYSESLCGPELSTLPGRAIPNGTMDVVSRAASREGSVHLSVGDKSTFIVPTMMNNVEYYVIPQGVDFRFLISLPIFIVPTMMNNVEYYVIPQGVDFRFLISLPIVETISRSECDPEYDVLVDPQTKDGWKFPQWLHARVDEELNAIEVIGSTHDADEHEEHTLIVCYAENDEEVKRARVVVALDVNT
ncbi:hypothetical protein RSAG8_00654, partial [Rhizoctonia solani AG-8 WAC10335]